MHSTTKNVYLDGPQIEKLRRVLGSTIPICPSPSSSTFPTLHIDPIDFLGKIFLKLKEHSIDVSSVRLNGGAASYVLIKDSNFAYRDIDILFIVNTPLTSERETTLYSSNNEPYLCDVWTMIKYIICSCLIEHMPDVQACTPTFLASILDTYTKKNIQICSEQDSWALLSLQNLLGKNLELKFIELWKRQWQFSVDSFQIDLRALLFEAQISTSSKSNMKISTRKQNEQVKQQASGNAAPSEFRFFTASPPSTNKFLSTNENSRRSQSSTHINVCEKPITKIRSRSVKPSLSSDEIEEQLSSATVQLQFLTNEDIDDGIVVDTDDSTIDDDESNYRTPPMELPTHPSRSSFSSSTCPITLLIPVYCAYKDLDEALLHLNNKLIATYEPEKLRGGGLLKYCDLLAQDYKPVNPSEMVIMQRYMCSRFFIDFKTLSEQISVVTKYVSTHFLPSSTINVLIEQNPLYQIYVQVQAKQMASPPPSTTEIDDFQLRNARLCLLFFESLLAVIQQSCVCLTGDDKGQLLSQMRLLQECYHQEHDHLFIHDPEHMRKYHTFPPPYSGHYRMQMQPRSHRQNYNRSWTNRNPRGNGYYPQYHSNNSTQPSIAVQNPRRSHQ